MNRLEALENENDILREKVLLLEEQLIGMAVLPIEWGLTATEQRLMGALLKRDTCTKEQLLAALMTVDHHDEPQIKIVDVFISKMRRKLRPFNIEIGTLWGRGYTIERGMRQRLNDEIRHRSGI